MLDASPDMFLVIDRNGTLVDFKPSASFEPAIPPEKFLVKSMESVLPGEIAGPVLLALK